MDNMPVDEDGFIFSYSNNSDRKVQFFYTYNKLYERSQYTDTWGNWRKIYPDYTTKLIQDNGYIVLNNELIFYLQPKKPRISLLLRQKNKRKQKLVG